VTVWSKLGAGSTFTLRLPLRPMPAGTEASQSPPALQPSREAVP
jgi:hypothetical protein